MSWRRLADAVVAELPRGSFAATIVGDEVRRGKPHPEPYLAAARALSVSPQGLRRARGLADRRALGHGRRLPGHRHPSHRRRAGRPRPSSRRFADRAPRRQPAGRRHPAAPAGAGGRTALRARSRGRRRRRSRPQRSAATSTADRHPDRRLGAVLGAARRTGDPRHQRARCCARSRRSGTRRTAPPRSPSTATCRPRQRAQFVAAVARRRRAGRALDRRRDAGGRDGRSPGRPCARGPPTSPRSAIWRRPTASTASTSTTSSSPSPTTAPRGRRLDPLWIDFITELGDRLHADGRTLSVSVPYINDTGAPTTAATGCTTTRDGAARRSDPHHGLRLLDQPRPGRSPRWRSSSRRSTAAKKAVDDDTKLALGVALYGYNWPVATVGTCPAERRG